MHLVFRATSLVKNVLSANENVVDIEVLVDLVEPPSLPHEPKQILDTQEKRTRHSVRRECLVKWKDRPEEGSTWES